MQLKDLVCCIVLFFFLNKILCAFCSLVGATIISIGFYTVMWGKATEEVDESVLSQESPTTENVPLLQSYKN